MARYIDVDKLNTRPRGNNSQRTMWREIKRIVDDAPTVDVVPKSEVDKVRLLAYESGKREVAREIRTALLKEIIEARNNNFEAIRERETKHNVNRFESTFCSVNFHCRVPSNARQSTFRDARA
jgi:hypothetical protein